MHGVGWGLLVDSRGGGEEGGGGGLPVVVSAVSASVSCIQNDHSAI